LHFYTFTLGYCKVKSNCSFLRKDTEMKKCSCGQTLPPRVDGERKTIDGKEVCDDCYFDAIGAQVEKHPITTPGRHGHGQANLE